MPASASAMEVLDGTYPWMLSRDLGPGVMGYVGAPGVTEIGSNPKQDCVWVERRSSGKELTQTPLSDAHLTEFLNRVADRSGEVLTPSSPVIEAALPQKLFGGARLSGRVPPLVPAPAFNIRILPERAYPLEAFVHDEEGYDDVDPVLSRHQYDRLVQSIKTYDNIFVVGGTGSGKTTLAMSILRKVSDLFPDERIVTLEDTPELRVASWCHEPFYKKGGRSYLDLIQTALRASPGRLVMGECRGPAILELFDTTLSGHPGAVVTFHAQSARKALRRMMIYCRRASDTDSHHLTIADAVDLILVLKKRGRGDRPAAEMTRVTGYSKSDGYDLQPL